jgi:integrase
MPRRAPTLTDKQVQALRTPGLYAVGGMVPGVALQVTQTAGQPVARSWVWRTTVSQRRRAFGLGSYPLVSLAEARQRALQLLRELEAAAQPVHAKPSPPKSPAPTREMTFQAAAQQFIDERRPSWRNPKHGQQWERTLATYAYPVLGTRCVRDIDPALVLQVLKPIWNTKTETANRVRDRIKLVLNWAKAHGFREGDNPAEWRGHLEHALAAPSKVAKVTHQPAVPVEQIGRFMRRLRSEQKDSAARALQFAILTAARDNEVRGATWNEIDLSRRIWIIPGERMKAGRAHRVPLSTVAVKLLDSLPRVAGSERVFPGTSYGGGMSANTLNEVIKRLHSVETVPSDVPDRPAVVHGMRSTFRNWGRQCTNFRPELLELSLAHTVGNAAERAYARDDALEQRREVLEAWAGFLSKTG